MVGLLVNIATSILFLVLLLQDQPLAAVLVGYVLCALQHRCDRWGLAVGRALRGPSLQADLARIASVLLMAALTLT